MNKPPFNIPRCQDAKLLVNQRALYLLQQGGTPSHSVLALPSSVGDGVNGYYLSLSCQILGQSKDYSRLSCFYVTKGEAFEYVFLVAKCGHCSLCNENRRTDFVFRCQMESELYAPTPPYFILLTYSNRNLPHRRSRCRPGELYMKDVQDFLKRLRMRWTRQGLDPHIRYVVCGEYGSRTHRPHYHMILWNNPYGASLDKPGLRRRLADDIYSAWSWCENREEAFGCEECADGAARYVSKYMSKLDRYILSHRPAGFHPPFINSSRGHGGIGSEFIRRQSTYLRDNPNINTLAWTSRLDYKYHEVNIGSYAKRLIWPSHARVVPNVVRQAHRELTNYYEQLVQRGALDYQSARQDLLNLLPSGLLFSFPSFIRPVKFCWLSTLSIVNRLWPTAEYLRNILLSYRASPMPYDSSTYYKKLASANPTPDISQNLAGLNFASSLRYSALLAEDKQ